MSSHTHTHTPVCPLSLGHRQLDHPNLCKFIGGSIEVPYVSIITEFCPKGSLSDVLLNDDIPINWGFRWDRPPSHEGHSCETVCPRTDCPSPLTLLAGCRTCINTRCFMGDFTPETVSSMTAGCARSQVQSPNTHSEVYLILLIIYITKHTKLMLIEITWTRSTNCERTLFKAEKKKKN